MGYAILPTQRMYAYAAFPYGNTNTRYTEERVIQGLAPLNNCELNWHFT